MSLSSKHNYTNKEIKYIKNGVITEYDMKNGGPSILKHKKLITDEEYDYLMSLDKLTCNIEVGNWLKDNKEVSIELMNGFREAREELFEKNDIQDDEVLSIKKDAVFLINKTLEKEQLNPDYLFRKKNQYTTYINLNNKEFYYNIFNDKFDIKGFSDKVLEKQNDHLFKFIKDIIKKDSDNLKDEVFLDLLEFKNSFIKKELPKEYYYDVVIGGYLFTYQKNYLQLDEINDELLTNNYLSIDNNLNMILTLISNLYS